MPAIPPAIRCAGAVLLVALGSPGAMHAQQPVDTNAVATLQDIHHDLFAGKHGIVGMGGQMFAGFYTNSAPPSPTVWTLGVVVDPQFGGQQALGLSAGPQYLLPDPTGRYPHRAALKLTGRIGVTGSRDVTFQFTAPGLHPDWRFVGVARIERLQRTQYFGVHNQVRVADSLVEQYGNIYYRHALRRATVYATVQRRLVGSLWLHVGGQLRDYRTSSLPDKPNLFNDDATAGLVTEGGEYGGRDVRLGLVHDTRDSWDAPTRGVYLEAMAVLGQLDVKSSLPDVGYQRYLVAGREFIPLGSAGRTVLALRQNFVLATDSLPFFLALEQVNTRMPDDGVIGPRHVRLHSDQLSSSQAVLTVELRRILLALREQPHHHVRLWGLAYVDGGSLWEAKPIARISFTHIWTVAAGLRGQVTNTSMAGFDVGLTDEGFRASVLTYFAF